MRSQDFVTRVWRTPPAEPDALAQEIGDSLQAAIQQVAAIANELRERETEAS
jgi:hypothetical protein